MDELQVRHIELIQNIITRMARNSFTIKSWAITTVSAILVFAFKSNDSDWYQLVALIPTFTFWGLDGYYLRREILFRKLYDSVRTAQVDNEYIERFSMNTKPYESDVSSWWRTCWTLTIVLLYGPFTLVVLISTFIIGYEDITKLLGA
ncbi:MAG: hypothetical protein IH948_03905 [Bacteroidetes bacterium]|nr:hypothetical protein [Bacteroidota bacterium]